MLVMVYSVSASGLLVSVKRMAADSVEAGVHVCLPEMLEVLRFP